jgi:large subunit ribosomal protein L21
MYAIIKSGAKQYRVKKGDVIDVDLLEGEAGQEVQFGEALLLNDGKETKVGSPTVGKSKVTGKIIGVVLGPKITSVKYKPSHNQRRKFGHRQKYLRVEITAIA